MGKRREERERGGHILERGKERDTEIQKDRAGNKNPEQTARWIN
jgi:hypothetical protein